jgi:hypothetical protein
VTAPAKGRRFAHFDKAISWAGGILGDSRKGSKQAKAQGYKWIDCDGHLSSDLYWVNAHGAPYLPSWMGKGDKFEHYSIADLRRKHKGLRTSLITFDQNAKLGLSTEWEVKDLHPLTGDKQLTTAFARLAADAHAAYGADWQKRVQVKVLTNLGGGLPYAKKVLRHAHDAGFDTILLPRGTARLKRISEPYITYRR